jgi:Protein of unknown function (DUF3102)
VSAAVPPVEARRLGTIATAVEAEHQAAHRDARSALTHALRCGELLLEAKAAVEHGEWLNWLRANTTVTARQSQRYMRLAHYREAVESQCDTGTHLTLRAALDAIAEPHDADADPEEDVWAWATVQLTGPFNAWDLDHVECGWLTTKLLRHLRVPAAVAVCVTMADEFEVPALRLVAADALVDALRLVVPYAKTDVEAPALQIDTAGMSVKTQFGAAFVLKITAQYVVGKIFHELEYRHQRTEEQLDEEWESTHARLMQRIDKRLAKIRAVEAPA